MGLFGGKATYVSSTSYNLVGDIAKRPNFLKTSVVSGVLGDAKSLGDTIRQSYQAGPGTTLKRYFSWTGRNYTQIGIPGGSIGGQGSYVHSAVGNELTTILGLTAGQKLWVLDVSTGTGDYAFWADQYMLKNHPTLVNTDWISEFDEASGAVIIIFADLTTATFMPANFDKNATYLFIPYGIIAAPANGPIVASGWTFVATPSNYPSTDGYSYLKRTFEGNYQLDHYTKTVYRGTDPDNGKTYSDYITLIHRENLDDTIPAGDTTRYSWSENTQKIYEGNYESTGLYIYKLGSGNTVFDQIAVDPSINYEGFLPFIPVRLDNKFVSSTYMPGLYAQTSRAYRRLTGERISKIVEKLEDNPSLGDIDFAYILPAVALNTKSNSGREYLFRFFNRMLGSQTTTKNAYTEWSSGAASFQAAYDQWLAWRVAQGNTADPLHGTPEPVVPDRPREPRSRITIKSSGLANIPNNLNMRVSWQIIEKTVGTGLNKPDAKKGDYWITLEADPPTILTKSYVNGVIMSGETPANSRFAIHWQKDANNWETLTVTGAVHENLIYNGKSVLITGKEALQDVEESGFLVPLHYQTLTEMSVVNFNQMAISSKYLVLNSYKVVKQKWYQTGIFKILVFVIIIATIALTGGFSAAGIGVLGSNLAVGTAIGFTGVAAIVAGVVANAVAAMVISTIITKGATAAFGAKIGAIVGVIASIIAINGLSNMAAGNGFTINFGSISRADTLVKATAAVSQAYSGYTRASIEQMTKRTQELIDGYKEEAERISELYAENIGYGRGVIDPMSLTNAASVWFEPPGAFLGRTLMTGSDIAELTLEMVSNFTDLSLDTDLNLA